MSIRILTCIIFISVFFAGCKNNNSNSGTLQIKLSHKVDNNAFQLDTMAYTCDAGYKYQVTKLNYYLSDFIFTKSDGSQYKCDSVFYVDAALDPNNILVFPNVAPGNYTKLNFCLGLDSIHDISNALPTTMNNINMQWPDMMGGGYHFMKLEGHYIDSTGTWGYAMHLGKNKNLVHIQLTRAFSISENNTGNLNLVMNINQWFRNPIYDFDKDGNYSMNNDTALYKLCLNGSNIFN